VNRTYCPYTCGAKTYSHSKAVRASFSVAWKNARAKASYAAGESLVTPAAVKIAMTMSSDAVADKLAMVFLGDESRIFCGPERSTSSNRKYWETLSVRRNFTYSSLF